MQHKEPVNEHYDTPSLNKIENSNDGYNVVTLNKGKINPAFIIEDKIKTHNNIEYPYSYPYKDDENIKARKPTKNYYSYAYNTEDIANRREEDKLQNNNKLGDNNAINEQVYSKVNKKWVNGYMGKQEPDYYGTPIIEQDSTKNKNIPEYAQVNGKK